MMKERLTRLGAVLALSTAGFLGCSDDDDDDNGPATGGAAGAATGGAATGGAAAGGTDMGGMGGSGASHQDDIVDTAAALGAYTTLAALLEEADLVDTLREEGPFTLFAPTDDAFDEFEEENPGFLGALSNEELSNVLRYHVVSGRVTLEDLEDGQEVETLADDNPTFTVNRNGEVTLIDEREETEDATVIEADIEASNGVIHVIDKVLLPPEE